VPGPARQQRKNGKLGVVSRQPMPGNPSRRTPMINTLATLLVFQTIGESLAYVFALPVPGPVIGMLLLFLFLLVRRGAADRLAPTSLELLKHLSLLFVPAGVGIMLHAQRVASEWLPIAVALVTSTIVAIVVTAIVVRRLQR
jgi:holin-like protein